ncbi:MAG: YihY/virulence factor BrkB family protein [Pseudomonadota bacterium]
MISGAQSVKPTKARSAGWPTRLDRDRWAAAAMRTYRSAIRNNLSLLSAGVAFYMLLALFPMLAALISVYGVVAEPSDVRQLTELLHAVAPTNAVDLIGTQMDAVLASAERGLTLRILLPTAISIWIAKQGVSSMIQGLNMIYREEDSRSLVHGILLSIVLTLALIGIAAVVLFGLVAVPAAVALLPVGPVGIVLADLIRWPLAAFAVLLGIGLIYRQGPSRRTPRTPWVTPGALIALFLWLIASAGFSFYVGNFSNYNETYGALGAVIGLLMWFFLSAFIILLGAAFNAELEHEEEDDTTVGAPRPMGDRGAVVADTLP